LFTVQVRNSMAKARKTATPIYMGCLSFRKLFGKWPEDTREGTIACAMRKVKAMITMQKK